MLEFSVPLFADPGFVFQFTNKPFIVHLLRFVAVVVMDGGGGGDNFCFCTEKRVRTNCIQVYKRAGGAVYKI